jgi:nucleoside-diphosphate-sugar epimerase
MHLFGKKTEINPLTMIMLSRPSADYSHAKASRLLGYQPKINLEEGMRRCESWLREQHIIG